ILFEPKASLRFYGEVFSFFIYIMNRFPSLFRFLPFLIIGQLGINSPVLGQSEDYKFTNAYLLGEMQGYSGYGDYVNKIIDNNFILLIYTEDSVRLIRFDLLDKSKMPDVQWGSNGRIDDFEMVGDRIYYLSNKKLLNYDIKKGELNVSLDISGTKASRIFRLSNDKLLIYELYPFHPLDGKSKIYVHVYHLIKKTLQTKYIEYKGIVFSQIVHQWLFPFESGFGIINPMNGIAKIYDDKINLIDTIQFNTRSRDTKMQGGEKLMESLYVEKQNDDRNFLHIVDSLGDDFKNYNVTHILFTQKKHY